MKTAISKVSRGLLFVLLVSATIGAAGLLINPALMPRLLPLEAVRFDGDLGRLRESDLRAAVADHLQGGLLGVDVAAIRDAVEVLPWVASVSVRRVWPDALRITVNEQVPIAQWGGSALMNAQAQVFRPQALPEHTLPALAGPPGSAQRVLAQYRALEQRLAPIGLGVSGLTLDERRAWTLALAEGGQIRLGREAITERVARLVAAWPQLSSAQSSPLAVADLRYPNGFALRWQDQD